MKPTYSTIDLSYIESIANGDKEVLKELANIIVEQITEYKVGLRNHFNSRSWKELGALAHKAKSSVITIGMVNLGNIELNNLELIAKQYRIDELRKMKTISEKEKSELNFITAQFESCIKERQQWIKENSNHQMINDIITKVNDACEDALNELTTVIR